MSTVHLIKMFQNARTRILYTISIKVEGRHISYNNYNRGEKNCIRYFRLATIRFATHFNAYNNNIHC